MSVRPKSATSDPLDERSSLLRSGEIDGMCLLDGETGRVLDANQQLSKMLGIERAALLGRELADFAAVPTEVKETIAGALAGVSAAQVTSTGFRREGAPPLAVELCLAPFQIDGRAVVSASLRDLTARTETIERLRQRVARTTRQRAALLHLSALDVTDFSDRLRQVLRADADTLEVERVSMWTIQDDPSSITLDALYHRATKSFDVGAALFARDYPSYFAALRSGGVINAEDAHEDPRTNEFSAGYLEAAGIGAMLDVPIYVHGRLVGVVCHEHVGGPRAWSVDEQQFAMSIAQMVSLAMLNREREDALRHAALHDPLTGLANRVLLSEHAHLALARYRRHHGLFALLYADLDGFKAVNDGLGHEAGDTLLRAIATRLTSCCRPSDVAARIGGDEFVVLLADVHGEHEAMRVASRIGEVLREPFAIAGREVRISASIGVVVGSEAHGTPDDLLRDADTAMYRAKAKGKARVEAFGA